LAREAAAIAPSPLTVAKAAGPVVRASGLTNLSAKRLKMQQMAYSMTQNTDVAKAFFTLQMAPQFYGYATFAASPNFMKLTIVHRPKINQLTHYGIYFVNNS